MSFVSQSIIKHKMGLLNLAEELGNVSQACRLMGVSRDTFYRVKEAKDAGGIAALLHKDRRSPNLKNRVEEATEAAVLAFALDNPARKFIGRRQRAGRRRLHGRTFRRGRARARLAPRLKSSSAANCIPSPCCLNAGS